MSYIDELESAFKDKGGHIDNLDALEIACAEVDRLRADLERVAREKNAVLDRLSDAISAQNSEALRLGATIARLTSDLAEARKDGERLDWCIKTQATVMESSRLKTRKPLPWTKDDLEKGFTISYLADNGDEIQTFADDQEPTPRAAIDAARDAGKGAKP